MDLCYAVGIQNREPRLREASGIQIVEYIKYCIRDKDDDLIEIVGDFFLPNPSVEGRMFSFVHRGDVNFEFVSGGKVMKDGEFHTEFLEKLYAPSLGCKFERRGGRLIGLPQFRDIGPVNVSATDSYRSGFLRLGKPTRVHSPFVLYRVEIPRRTFGFVRVHGIIEGDVLNRLTNNKTRFHIYGGEILLGRVRSIDLHNWAANGGINANDTDDYRRLFEEFVQNSYVEPERYDLVLWSERGTRTMKTRRLSRDLFLGCEGYLLQGETINWYWSKSAYFHAFSYPNGLHLGVEPETRGSVDRVLVRH